MWWSSASTSDTPGERPPDLRRSGSGGLCGPRGVRRAVSLPRPRPDRFRTRRRTTAQPNSCGGASGAAQRQSFMTVASKSGNSRVARAMIAAAALGASGRIAPRRLPGRDRPGEPDPARARTRWLLPTDRSRQPAATGRHPGRERRRLSLLRNPGRQSAARPVPGRGEPARAPRSRRCRPGRPHGSRRRSGRRCLSTRGTTRWSHRHSGRIRTVRRRHRPRRWLTPDRHGGGERKGEPAISVGGHARRAAIGRGAAACPVPKPR
jgi:hypothetical protein